MKLKTIKILFLACGIGTLLTACQKEVDFQDLGGPGTGNNNTVITGNWNFTGLNAKTNTAITVAQAGQEVKAVTTSDYSSTNNTGTLTVTNNQFIFTGIGHTVNSVANVKTYLNGILFDNTDEPFDAITPPTDNTLDYVRNSNDSLTFTNGFAIVPDPSGGTTSVPAGPMGGRINVVGDILTLTIKSVVDTTFTQGGIPAVFDARLEGIMKFKHQ